MSSTARDVSARRSKFRQAMIALRPDDDIHGLLAAENFRPFGLRDAASDDDRGLLPGLGARRLEHAQLAEFGKNLLGGAFPDVARVQDHEIGVFHDRGLGIAFRREDIGHALPAS